MFIHSVKVPRLYKIAANIIKKVKEDGCSLKELVYKKKHPNIKAIYALVLIAFQNEDNLNTLIRRTKILTEDRLDPWLARILITELLWGKKKLLGDSKPIKTVLSYEEQFLKENVALKKVKRNSKKALNPKYVRINTLKMTVADAIDMFCYEGWSLVRCGNGSDYAAFLATSASLGEDQFMVDILVKDLLLFPPGTQFYEHKCYINGSFVLQDKASCLAPLLLNPPVNSTVLDMCSAPGMKCMQIAAMIENTGQIYAVERDQRRFETLKNLLDKADATNVKPINKDVLTLTHKDIPDVEYILVDPTCSGSGMLDRVEFKEDASKCDESRLQKLAGFQITLLRHALNNFKSAKRIVYSTCSIYSQENEEVVQQAITTSPNFKLVPLNEMLKDKWYNFGSKDYGKIGEKCLYAKSELDHTNGFFIALFERLSDGEVNEHFIKRVHRASELENVENNEELVVNVDIQENVKMMKKSKKRKMSEDKITKNNMDANIIEETNKETKKKKKAIKNHDNIEEDTDIKRTKKCKKRHQETLEKNGEQKKKIKKNKNGNIDDIIDNNIDEIKVENVDIVKEKKFKKKKNKN